MIALSEKKLDDLETELYSESDSYAGSSSYSKTEPENKKKEDSDSGSSKLKNMLRDESSD
ncbi:MAG: hypothetical protein ACFCU6_09230 [Balneolaceae bacterium]